MTERVFADDDVMNVAEAAASLGLREGVIKRLMTKGDIPNRVIGRVRVTTRGELKRWLYSVSVVHYVPTPPEQRLPKRWTMYRFFDADGDLLYVGMTTQGATRWHQHSKDQPWWLEVATVAVEHLPSFEALVEAELASIRTERPRYNIKDKP